jgi:hypothetical protein
MHPRIARYVVLVAVIVSSGCATSRSVQNAPLHAGTSRIFAADYERTLRAAREAVVETGLQMESVREVDANTMIILARKGVGLTTWGELVRVTISRESAGQTRVAVHTERRVRVDLLAKGDYGESVLSNVELKLR